MSTPREKSLDVMSQHTVLQRDLPVAETFTSIQGEGALAGVPSYFLRTSGCNLRCVWCDTPYASWNPEGELRTVEDITNEIRSSGVRHIVLTGGEPMIFPQLLLLSQRLRDDGFHQTIETAGTVFRELPIDLMSISPKLANSTPGAAHGGWSARHEDRRLNYPVLQQLIDQYPNRQFKFVVQGKADLAEIESILNRLTGWKNEEIFLMPEGVAAPAPELKDFVIEMCIARNWRYGHRLHIELFGNTRGT